MTYNVFRGTLNLAQLIYNVNMPLSKWTVEYSVLFLLVQKA